MPHSIDVHVGTMMRNRRKALGMSQTALAEGLGMTFQQVQKYERGVNRVSASVLFTAGQYMGVPVSYFFQGLEGDAAEVHEHKDMVDAMAALAAVPAVAKVGRLNRESRHSLAHVIESMVSAQQ